MPHEPCRANPSARLGNVAPVLGAVLLAATLRFVALDRVPPALNQDEANRAYEAYCLLKTGQDHFGKPWPIFFRAFGNADYPPGPYIYSLIPIQAVLGMNVFTTRLPAALLGTLHVWFVYLLVRRFYGRGPGLLAAVLLAVSPWHVHLSRLAFEVSLALPLVTLGLYLVVRGLPMRDEPGDRPVNSLDIAGLLGGGAALGLALWTYNALRVVVPLLLLGGAALFFRRWCDLARRPRGLRALLALVIGLLVGLAPFLWASIRSPEEAWARAGVVNVFHANASLPAALWAMLRGYALHFGPAFLFLSGDEIAVQHVPGYGQLHPFYILLLPLGLYRLVPRWRTERFGPFALWWILIAPLPAAVTPLTVGHSLRSAGVLPAYEIVAALGLDLILTAALRRSRGLYRFVGAAAGGTLALACAWFCYLFFVRYPVSSAPVFQVEWPIAFAEAARVEADYDAMLFTSRDTYQLASLYLFWNRIEPAQYFALPRWVRTGRYWDDTLRIGKAFFLPSEALANGLPVSMPNPRVLVAERPGVPVPGRELRRIYYPDGTPALILYDARAGRP